MNQSNSTAKLLKIIDHLMSSAIKYSGKVFCTSCVVDNQLRSCLSLSSLVEAVVTIYFLYLMEAIDWHQIRYSNKDCLNEITSYIGVVL